ncbi:MAG TPA: DUF58 domain-containing protein [Aquimonas sp.]|nr:DUF58 domain-containing protein [Aquimonas sp.]HRF54998.1 DUF58 domain-containing protein [Aquimonas sp.]
MNHSLFEPTMPELLSLRARAGELASGARRRSADRDAGTRHSPFRGRGMDYAESRAYAAGDDVRHIDWRVTARSGELHTKLFAPERERTSAVVVDTAAAMGFGTRACYKTVAAARLAALFVWAAVAQGDRICAASFGRHGGLIPSLAGRRGALRALDAICRWSSQAIADTPSETTLSVTLDSLARGLNSGAHVLLVVDQRSVDEDAERALRRLRRHHDVMAVVLVDAFERSRLPSGVYRVAALAGEAQLVVEADGEAPWQQAWRMAQESAVWRLRKVGAGAMIARSDQDPVQVLRDLLRGVPAVAVGE